MSRSFRKTYLNLCWQALRGWHEGKKHQIARARRRKLSRLYDEEGTPIMPKQVGGNWLNVCLGHGWVEPNKKFKIIKRNGRYFLKFLDDEWKYRRSYY